MEDTTTTNSLQRTNADGVRRVLLPILVVVLLVVVSFAGYQWWYARQASLDEAAMAQQQAEMTSAVADRWGFRPTHVSILADGGLVEFRFLITDPDKVIFLFDELENVPRLIDEDTGTEVSVNNVPHSHDVPAGLTEYIIYRNIDGAIEPGDYVSIVVGDLQIPHFQVLK